MSASIEPDGAAVRVGWAGGTYTVLIRPGLLNDLPHLLAGNVDAHRFAIISDDNVAPLHGERVRDVCRAAGLDVTLLTFPAGEASKTRKSWSILTDEMLDAGLGRDCCVVAVGGGVTTDLAGFVAATYMRGVPVVQVPTSYLAMIDASVGGKTGVDVRAGKNLVGAFHAPELVVADPEVLGTLPRQERVEGLVEAFKHGAILDRAYLDTLAHGVRELVEVVGDAPTRAVLHSVQLKADVVTKDEREAGYRQILNFGHTVGHAVEALSDFTIGHGRAVAFGMLVEARLGESLGVTQPGTADALAEALGSLIDLDLPAMDVSRVVSVARSDKKSREGTSRVVLLRTLGEVDEGRGWAHDVSEGALAEALEAAWQPV